VFGYERVQRLQNGTRWLKRGRLGTNSTLAQAPTGSPAIGYGILPMGSVLHLLETELENGFLTGCLTGRAAIRMPRRDQKFGGVFYMSAKRFAFFAIVIVIFCATWVVAQRAPAGGAAPAGSSSAGQTQAPGTATPPPSSATPPASPATPPAGSATPASPSGVPGSNSTNPATPGNSTSPSTVNPNTPNTPGMSPGGSPCGTLPNTAGTPGSPTPNPGSSNSGTSNSGTTNPGSSPSTSGNSQGNSAGVAPNGTPCPPAASPSGNSGPSPK